MDIQQLFNNVQNVCTNFEAITDKFHNDHGADYIDLNEEQMDAGQDALGGDLPEYRNPIYAQLKRSRGSKSGGKWDMKLTGDFRRAMKFQNDEIFTTDSKAAKFSGIELFGVQPERLNKYAKDQLIPEFNDLIITKLGL